MRYLLFHISLLLIQLITQAQTDSTALNSFLILFNNNFMTVENEQKVLIYKKQFNSSFSYLADIDRDGFDELIVVDSVYSNSKLIFYIYFFSGKVEFKIIDSIYSGTYYPFLTYAEEISNIIIQTGNPDFEWLNLEGETFALPINIWKFEEEKIIPANTEVYEPFLFENENLIRQLDYYVDQKFSDCTVVEKFKNIIASVFVNYLNAGEYSLAEQFYNNYYSCSDKLKFKQQILDLIFPKAK